MTVSAAPPAWWSQPDMTGHAVLDTAVADPNPMGPANIGQAKFMAKRALDALNTCDPALAVEIHEKLTVPQPKPSDPSALTPALLDFGVPGEPLPDDWHERQHAPLLVGQLKAIATPFYDKLHAVAPTWLDHESPDPAAQGQLQLNATKDQADPSNFYPWSSNTGDDQNQAVATIGQLKAVFSLRFESLGATLDSDYDDDGLTNTEEASHQTDPRNPDTDSDGMNDAWEVQWGLDPLNATDASADIDGDSISNQRESQLGTSPTGIYRIEILPLGANKYFHSAADDGSVVVRQSPGWLPDTPLELITVPDDSGTRTVVPLPSNNWLPLNAIVAGLLANGTLHEGESLSPCGPDSSDGTYRVFQTNAGGLLLIRQPGYQASSLPTDAAWQAISNRGQAAAVTGRDVPSSDNLPEHLEADLLIFNGYFSSTTPMPAEWFPAPAIPSVQAFSDDRVLVRRHPANPDGSACYETCQLNASPRIFTPVRLPGLGGESIVSLSPMNGRMLGSGPKPFQITLDGSPCTLESLHISTTQAPEGVPLATLYPNPLVPNFITSDGRITLTTTDASNHTILLQIIPSNDADHDGMMDDWEKSFAKMLLDFRRSQADWGPLYADLTAGNLDPATDYTGEGITAAELAQLFNRPPSEQAVDGIQLQSQGRRNMLAWASHTLASNDTPESFDGIFYYENSGYYGAGLKITRLAQLQPQYLADQLLSNPWENSSCGSGWSRFTIHYHLVEHPYYDYSGDYQQARIRLVANSPNAHDRTRSFLKVTTQLEYPYYDDHWSKVTEVESKELKIPAGQLVSEWVEIIPPIAISCEYSVLLQPFEIVPDYNRDGKITAEDHGKVKPAKPLRFWINNDDDSGETGGDDIPQVLSETAGFQDRDSWDTQVDGVRDLIDFFPLHFDLRAILQVVPETKYEYFLMHETETIASIAGFRTLLPSFNVVWYPEAILEEESVKPSAVGAYLRNVDRAIEIAGRPSNLIPSTGLRIPNEMLEAARQGKGVALFESRFATTNPLVLEIRNRSGTVLGRVMFPLRTSEVESMFRSKFLNENLDGWTQGAVPPNPPNWPDEDRNKTQFVYLHGYNVSGEQARGCNSEFFKRLFWSGSNAMFTGISWHGNESQMMKSTPDYWRNVHNAFQTSKAVADFVNALPGESKSIAAHSLGNMVVSSAIADHKLVASNYFMIDAAVALEAYSPASSNKDMMSNPDWRPYQEHLWSTEWHMLFNESDNRRKMTWRNRFGALPHIYNFYSSGEEVLKNGDGTVPGTSEVVDTGKLAWVKQEMTKGSSFLSGGGLLHYGNGGWAFDNYWDIVMWTPLYSTVRRRSPQEAQSISRDKLEKHPFFEGFVNSKFHDPALGSQEAAKYDEVSKALSESLPALSFAAGANPIDILNSAQISCPGRNYNMMTLKNQNKWPRTDEDWLHGDIRSVAYLYTRQVYDIIANIGQLNQ
jgi:hypothetical protein